MGRACFFAPALIGGRPLPSRRRVPAGPRKPAPRLSTAALTASSTTSPRSPARPRPGGSVFLRRDRLLAPDCDPGLNCSPGLAPTFPGLLQAHPIEGQETGRERLLPLIERPFARI